MARGGWREGARGKVGPKPKFRPVLPTEYRAKLQLIAWARYGRPTTEDEEAATVAALIDEEANRLLAAK